MILPLARGEARKDGRTLDLDIQLATRVYGFRWMRWLPGGSPDPPRESRGRFLARPGEPLAHLYVSAPPSLRLAAQPYRHLPRYSLDERLALRACEQVGLFEDGGITLARETDGSWSLELPGGGRLAPESSLSTLLARAALRWHALDGRFRKGLQ